MMGCISGEEASLAAADFVRWADANGTGSVDPTALDWALQSVDVSWSRTGSSA